MKKVQLVAALCVAGLAFSASAAGTTGKAVDLDRAAPSPAVRETLPERTVGGVARHDLLAAQEQLQHWLFTEMAAGALVAPIEVRVTADDLLRLDRADKADRGKSVVGLVKPFGHRVDFASLHGSSIDSLDRPVAGGMLRIAADGGFVWSLAVSSAGAQAMRLHLTDLSLPPTADLFVYSLDGQAFGPYRGDDTWTNTIFGEMTIVQLRFYGPAMIDELADVSFAIDEVGHIGAAFLPGGGIAQPESASPVDGDHVFDLAQAATPAGADTLSFCSFNESCIENASCGGGPSWGAKSAAQDATALMLWVSGAFINTCTGGLVADTDGGSQIPYVLTANHCISKGRDAKNAEFYFQFSVGCGGGCPAEWQGGGVQSQPSGANLLATGNTGDYTLLELKGTPPAGSAFMGWTTANVANANGADLYRISHPSTAPQAYSAQTVDTSAGTCQGLPRGAWIYSRDTYGATEGGSSGSPVYNAAGQIVGQLTGACGFNTGDPCDSSSNATIDGAFANYFSSVEQWLDPGTSCTPEPEVCDDGSDNDCDGAVDCADGDCSGDPSCSTGGCTLGQPGDSCSSDGDCCSNKCKGPPSNQTCR